MRNVLVMVLLLAFVACQKKPTAEEIDEMNLAKRSPTPKPTDWMWKSYKNPLEHPDKAHPQK